MKAPDEDAQTSIRALDPVDPAAPPPDGARLLKTVLATPPHGHPGAGRLRLLHIAPLGLALTLVLGVVAVLALGGVGSGDEQEAAGGTNTRESSGSGIIHYVVREKVRVQDGRWQQMQTLELWQLEDESRGRTISSVDGQLWFEEAVTRTQLLIYHPNSDADLGRPTIVRYRASDDFESIPEEPPEFGAPMISGASVVGDPRTVPDRLANGDPAVKQLDGATVRGVEVAQYAVSDCGESSRSEPRGGGPRALEEDVRAVVALARDAGTPVRVTLVPCSGDGLTETVLDYLEFESLPPTDKNLELLEMSTHPGVRVVDGIDIDKAEEDGEIEPGEAKPVATPTPPPGVR